MIIQFSFTWLESRQFFMDIFQTRVDLSIERWNSELDFQNFLALMQEIIYRVKLQNFTFINMHNSIWVFQIFVLSFILKDKSYNCSTLLISCSWELGNSVTKRQLYHWRCHWHFNLRLLNKALISCLDVTSVLSSKITLANICGNLTFMNVLDCLLKLHYLLIGLFTFSSSCAGGIKNLDLDSEILKFDIFFPLAG